MLFIIYYAGTKKGDLIFAPFYDEQEKTWQSLEVV